MSKAASTSRTWNIERLKARFSTDLRKSESSFSVAKMRCEQAGQGEKFPVLRMNEASQGCEHPSEKAVQKRRDYRILQHLHQKFCKTPLACFSVLGDTPFLQTEAMKHWHIRAADIWPGTGDNQRFASLL